MKASSKSLWLGSATHLLLAITLFLVARGFALSQTPPKALSKAEVTTLLQGDVSSEQVADIARKRGIDFQITPEVEKELRAAGATNELIETLRGLAPTAPKRAQPVTPPAPPAPALLQIEGAPKGAEVYVDDEFKGQASGEGRLRIPGLSAAKHVVRVSADGFTEKVETIEVNPGETRIYTPNLARAAKTPAVSSPALAAPTPLTIPGLKPLLVTPGVSLYYDSMGSIAKLSLLVHKGDSPVINVDLNASGRIDKGDTGYALTNDDNPCTMYLLGGGATTLCGTFHSGSALQVKDQGDTILYVWTIPKSELNPDGKSVPIVVRVYSTAAKRWASYPSEPFTAPLILQLQ